VAGRKTRAAVTDFRIPSRGGTLPPQMIRGRSAETNGRADHVCDAGTCSDHCIVCDDNKTETGLDAA